MHDEARCELVNRLLIMLGIKPISQRFYDLVFGGLDFANLDAVRAAVHKFRMLCMLEYGNFRFGYKIYRADWKQLKTRWYHHFPKEEDVVKTKERMQRREDPPSVPTPIDSSLLFSLGYLAKEHAPVIGETRQKLSGVINTALERGVQNWSQLVSIAQEKTIPDLPRLIAQCGIPGGETLLGVSRWVRDRSYRAILTEVQESCKPVDDTAINDARELGRRNAATYLAMHDLDVYVATSMRLPLHFTTNAEFLSELFKSEQLRDIKPRYFDPTLVHVDDRIRKGLMECLMIRRAKVTLYNAQDLDTFGKDSELGVTLAHRKPAVVYVARMFNHDEVFSPLYKTLDQILDKPTEDFLRDFQESGHLTQEEATKLQAPEVSRADILEFLIRKVFTDHLGEMNTDEKALELVRHGYSPPEDTQKLLEECISRIANFERRALTFRDIHPLSLQTSPFDGVARGIIVTRSVTDTAATLRGLLLNNLEYEIIEQEENWLLVDKITHSPIRVVTKDPLLTAAFWSEPWGQGGARCPYCHSIR